MSDGKPHSFAISGGARYAYVSVNPYSSYCCTVRSDNDEIPIVFGESDPLDLAENNMRFRGRAAPPVAVGPWIRNAARLCFITTIANSPIPTDRDGIQYIDNSAGIFELELKTVGRSSAETTSGNLSCESTVLRGGYNFSAADLVYVEISNFQISGEEAGGDVDVVLKATASRSATAQATTKNITATIAAGSRFDIPLHLHLLGDGTARHYGTLVLSHNGAPGSLKVYVASYRTDEKGALVLLSRDELN